ncbi:MAG: hypothetical protein KA369_19750 [Spirochaetes bacterium]|nr:hypothetical protein [Spirochaetota bacterium]
MKKALSACGILLVAAMAATTLSCSKGTTKKNGPAPDNDISLDRVDIEKKYLAEGFITSDLFRVVIVSPKEAGATDMDSVQNKARKRARISIEQNLAGSNIPCDRNTKAEIINLINNNGQLNMKDIDHRKYNVFYFDITKKNMKNYLKNIASQR